LIPLDLVWRIQEQPIIAVSITNEAYFVHRFKWCHS